MSRSSILSLSVFAVIAYMLVAWLLIGWSVGTVALALWTASPLTAPLLVVAVASRYRTRAAAAGLLACFWVVGAALLFWGLVLDRGNYNHLVAIFLPIYMFAFLLTATCAYFVFSLVRTLVRGSGN